MDTPNQTPGWLRPVQPWTFSKSSTTVFPSDDSSGGTPKPETTSDPVDQREAEIATWVQTMVALVPAAITLVVSFGIDVSGEQQLAMAGLAGAVGTCALITWRTFRKRRRATG